MGDKAGEILEAGSILSSGVQLARAGYIAGQLPGAVLGFLAGVGIGLFSKEVVNSLAESLKNSG